MPLKRQLRESEIPIFDNAYIHQRGDYWQLHMWLEREGKYARKSLRTRSQSTAVERAKHSTWKSLLINSLAKPTSASQ